MTGPPIDPFLEIKLLSRFQNLTLTQTTQAPSRSSSIQSCFTRFTSLHPLLWSLSIITRLVYSETSDNIPETENDILSSGPT